MKHQQNDRTLPSQNFITQNMQTPQYKYNAIVGLKVSLVKIPISSIKGHFTHNAEIILS